MKYTIIRTSLADSTQRIAICQTDNLKTAMKAVAELSERTPTGIFSFAYIETPMLCLECMSLSGAGDGCRACASERARIADKLNNKQASKSANKHNNKRKKKGSGPAYTQGLLPFA